ncbi:MAG: hypothetical protein M1838_001072 [Thelocarpon superellum]|nr:MAG: hypothetical protein M1838_001072 [Thelocarpon superellum]
MTQLLETFSSVTRQVQAVANGRPVRLVAVSKLKPASDILALHQAPHQHIHFGENYLQELQAKASMLPTSIAWHFIGALQTNKCASLSQIPNLFLVSSVDTAKKADALNKGRAKLVEESQASSPDDHAPAPLRIHVQVNTSGEESKSGVAPSEASQLCAHVRTACPALHLQGLMTIGAIARSQASTAETVNEDFECLREVRDAVARDLHLSSADLELSMGMSDDYESAIKAGSDEVRIGSTIFGTRPPRNEAQI